MSPDTTYTVLRGRILTKLQGLSKLQEVNDYPKARFSGFPAATIEPIIPDSSDYETNTEDLRFYSFRIHIYYQSKVEQGAGSGTGLDALYDAIDDVLDSFAGDKNLTDDGSLGLPTGKTLVGVRPVNAEWGTVDESELIDVTVDVTIIISIDNT